MQPNVSKLSKAARAEWDAIRKWYEEDGLDDSRIDAEMEGRFELFVVTLKRYVGSEGTMEQAAARLDSAVSHWLWLEAGGGPIGEPRRKLYRELAGQAVEVVTAAMASAVEAVKAEREAAEAAKLRAEATAFQGALDRGLRLLRA
jgi:hypothetical protein